MITITDSAVEAIRVAFEDEKKDPKAGYLRVGVKGGGCSGFMYDLTIVDDKNAGDAVVEKDGVRVIIDVKSQLYLAGTTLDHTSGLSGRGFQFVNPNASGTCGCGESFTA